MSAHDPALVAKVTRALLDEGAAPGNSIHSWRCEYPDRYGDCDCVEQTAREVLDAVADQIRAQERERIARAIEALPDAYGDGWPMRAYEVKSDAAAIAREGGNR